ncbi:MAG: hypothetical protein ACRDNS_34100, partial [Trebonia sp.]
MDKGSLRNDVLRYPLGAISVALGVFPDLAARLDAAAGRVQPAPPPPGQEVVDAIERAVKSVVFRLGPEINRRTRITIGVAVLGTGLLGGAIGYVAGAVSRPAGPVAVCWQQEGGR